MTVTFINVLTNFSKNGSPLFSFIAVFLRKYWHIIKQEGHKDKHFYSEILITPVHAN